MNLIRLSRQSSLLSKDASIGEKLLGWAARGRQAAKGSATKLRGAPRKGPADISSLRSAGKAQPIPQATAAPELRGGTTAVGKVPKELGQPITAQERRLMMREPALPPTSRQIGTRIERAPSPSSAGTQLPKTPSPSAEAPANVSMFTSRQKKMLGGGAALSTGLGIASQTGEPAMPKAAGALDLLVRGGLAGGKQLGRLAFGGKVRRGITAAGLGAASTAGAGAKAQWGVPLKARRMV